MRIFSIINKILINKYQIILNLFSNKFELNPTANNVIYINKLFNCTQSNNITPNFKFYNQSTTTHINQIGGL